MPSKGARARSSERAVPDEDLDLGVSHLDECRSRPLGELGNPFDGHDLRRQLGEHRRLVARAGADVENALVSGEPEQLADRRDHEGLRDRLPASDRESIVLVGEMVKILGNEALAWDSRHRFEHALVEASAAAQLMLDHVLRALSAAAFGVGGSARPELGSFGERPQARVPGCLSAAHARSGERQNDGHDVSDERDQGEQADEEPDHGHVRGDPYARRPTPQRTPDDGGGGKSPDEPCDAPATVSGISPITTNPKAAPAAAPMTAATPAPTAFTPRSPERMTPNPRPRPSASPSVYQRPISVQCRERRETEPSRDAYCVAASPQEGRSSYA